MDFIVQNAAKSAQETNNGLEQADLEVGVANIKVIGVGGAGGNMVNWLYKKSIKGAEIMVPQRTNTRSRRRIR